MSTVELYDTKRVRIPVSPGNRKKQPMATRPSALQRLAENTDLPLKRRFPAKRLVLTLIIFCTGAISMIWLQLKIDNLSTQIKELEEKKLAVQSMNHYLRLKLEKSTTYDDIYPLVKSRFGMDLQSAEPVILEVPDDALFNNK